MKIIVNGEQTEVEEGSTAHLLLQKLGLPKHRLALEVNEEIVPRSKLSQCVLQAGDRVEVVHAVGGG